MLIADALREAETAKDAWQLAHQGQLLRIVADVWYCGDDWCACSEAQITALFVNLADRRFVVRRVLWRGSFFTDGESGASAELAAKRDAVGSYEPLLASRIVWPEDGARG